MGKRSRAKGRSAAKVQSTQTLVRPTVVGRLRSCAHRYGLLTRGVEGGGTESVTPRGIAALAFVLFLLAFLVRGGMLLAHWGTDLLTVPVLDARAYMDWAEEILGGGTRSLGTYFTEPGYAYLLAATIALFGSHLPLLVVQTVLGSMVAPILFVAARRLFGHVGIAFTAGVVVALLRPAVFFDVLIGKTALEFFLSACVILVLVYLNERRDIISYAGAGLLIGLTALVKANILYVSFLIAGALFLARPREVWPRAARQAGALVAAALLAISPATIHNIINGDSFVPINYSGGVSIYLGNWEHADGSFVGPEYFSIDPVHEEESWHGIAEALSGTELTAQETSSFWLHEGIKEALAFPLHTIGVTLKKAFLLVSSLEIADNYVIDFGEERFPPLHVLVPFWLVALLGLVGLVWYVRDSGRHPWFLYAFLAGHAGLLTVTKVAERYRLVLALVFALFAGYALYKLWELWRQRHLRVEAVLATGGLALLALLIALPSPRTISTQQEDLHLAFAGHHLEHGNLDAALPHIDRGLLLSPLHEPLLQYRGHYHALAGDAETALEAYRDALRARPDASTTGLALAYACVSEGCEEGSLHTEVATLFNATSTWEYNGSYLLGMRAMRRGDDGEARALLEEAFAGDPDIRGLRANLALLYGKLGDNERSRFYLSSFETTGSFDVVSMYNLANAYARDQRFADAAPLYQRVNDLVPDFQLARYSLARMHLALGNHWKAREEFSAFIEHAEAAGVFPEQVENARRGIGTAEQQMINSIVPQES